MRPGPPLPALLACPAGARIAALAHAGLCGGGDGGADFAPAALSRRFLVAHALRWCGEADALALLSALMHRVLPPHYFDGGLAGAARDQRLLAEMLLQCVPGTLEALARMAGNLPQERPQQPAAGGGAAGGRGARAAAAAAATATARPTRAAL